MGKKVICCMTNFGQFQYRDLLQELVQLKHDVSLSPCQGYCASCRQQPTAIIDDQMESFENIDEMRQYIIKE